MLPDLTTPDDGEPAGRHPNRMHEVAPEGILSARAITSSRRALRSNTTPAEMVESKLSQRLVGWRRWPIKAPL